MTQLEKELEAKLVHAVINRGGRCLKWTSPGTTGLPDRIILLPGGRIAFAELKRPKGSKVGQLQLYWRRFLLRLGFKHYIIFTAEDLAAALEELEAAP